MRDKKILIDDLLAALQVKLDTLEAELKETAMENTGDRLVIMGTRAGILESMTTAYTVKEAI